MAYGERPPCHCGASTEILWAGKSHCVIGDDIPGGMEIRHGICNEDGSPRKFYSKSEMARVAKERGNHNHVEHIGSHGSDKNPHTTRWI
jgi:hypothetical protein